MLCPIISVHTFCCPVVRDVLMQQKCFNLAALHAICDFFSHIFATLQPSHISYVEWSILRIAQCLVVQKACKWSQRNSSTRLPHDHTVHAPTIWDPDFELEFESVYSAVVNEQSSMQIALQAGLPPSDNLSRTLTLLFCQVSAVTYCQVSAASFGTSLASVGVS